MANAKNIPFETLLDLTDQRLPAQETADLLDLIPLCDEATQADWAWIQAFKDSLMTNPTLEATRNDLLMAFRQNKRGAWRRKLQQMVAVSFDSWATRSSLAPVGARSAELASATRQLVFSTDTLDIALELRSHKTTTVITGQILQNMDVDLTAWTIDLFSDGDQVASVTSDDLGEFEFSASPSLDFQLALRYEKDEVSDELLTEPFGLQ